MCLPQIILLFSGKRKSGKDFVAEKLCSRIGADACVIVRISEPIKSYYAKEKGLDLQELMSDNAYKEEHRKAMIDWSDEVRRKDAGYFCKAACAKAPVKKVWVVSDVRRKTDIKWFKDCYIDKIRTVRIQASDSIRKERGFIFTKGVDDVMSECDLDDYTSWDIKVNNNNSDEFNAALNNLMEMVNEFL